jgi:peptide alpha-N-acetyltransferase
MEIKREEIEYKMYNKETKETIDKMAEMIGSELSEPYSVFTYYYFLEKWPQLCYIAYHNNNIVGLILGKLEPHSNNSSVSGSTNRGYIAMIVVS